MIDKPTVPPHKVILVYILFNILTPGLGEIYLGTPYRRLGALTLLTFCLSIALIIGIIGIFTTPLIWFGVQGRTIMTVLRTAQPKVADDV